METLKPKYRGDSQINTAPIVQENGSISDTDIVNEVDSLLHMYKIALEGGVWSKLDKVFDSVQNVEYELAQWPDVPILFEENDPSVMIIDEPIAQPLIETAEFEDKSDNFFTKAAAYIKENKRLAIIAGTAIIFLAIITSVITGNNHMETDTRLESNTQAEQMNQSGNAEVSTTTDLDKRYHDAVALMDSGKYDEAISAFEELEGYQDSDDRISECHYIEASMLHENGDMLHALSRFSKAGSFKDAPAQAAALRKLYQKSLQLHTISAGRNHTVALKEDGTVVTAGSNDYHQCDVSDWTDIVSVSVGDTHTAGLKADGRVLSMGAINYGQSSVSEWWDIVAISAKRYHTVGLKSDGTVRAAGRGDYGQCDVWEWQDIVAISTGDYHTVGLKTDGSVVAVGNNTHNQCNVSTWTDMIGIYAGDSHTVGLRADGTVVAVGYNAYGQCDVSEWKDIVDIGIGISNTVGLKSDGTVLIAGYPYGELEKVCAWTDIVDISVGAAHITGLKSDGTVVIVNYTSNEQSTISEWTGIKRPKE